MVTARQPDKGLKGFRCSVVTTMLMAVPELSRGDADVPRDRAMARDGRRWGLMGEAGSADVPVHGVRGLAVEWNATVCGVCAAAVGQPCRPTYGGGGYLRRRHTTEPERPDSPRWLPSSARYRRMA